MLEKLCNQRNIWLLILKLPIKKKHDANFKNLITDLKSARKNTKKKFTSKRAYFFKKITQENCNVWN